MDRVQDAMGGHLYGFEFGKSTSNEGEKDKQDKGEVDFEIDEQRGLIHFVAADLPVTRELIHRWQQAVVAGIRHMQSVGEITTRIDAERAAAALIAGVQGGVIVYLSTGEIGNLEAALDIAIENLRRP